ncbi:MAG: signal peptidase I [Candidatus Sericytochromatia bacterium]|nr:signal peptidase I [Candidatus Sericytochromatia bacterium]
MSRQRSKAAECGAIFVAFAGGAFLSRALVVEARYIPSGSMRPALQVGDRLLVDKLTPRWRLPHRGDVVVCRAPVTLPGLGPALVKRVVGLPGERLRISNRRVWVNGAPLTEPWSVAPISYGEPDWAALGMPGGVVPPDTLFVLGDNRNDSTDSHVFGPVPAPFVIGRAVLRVWPLGRFGRVS